MLTDFLVEDFANREPYDYLPTNYNMWYVGIEYTVEEGFNNLLDNLNRQGHILIGKPEIADYIWEGLSNELIYIILYKSLSKLEYLEYKYQEKVDKNV